MASFPSMGEFQGGDLTLTNTTNVGMGRARCRDRCVAADEGEKMYQGWKHKSYCSAKARMFIRGSTTSRLDVRIIIGEGDEGEIHKQLQQLRYHRVKSSSDAAMTAIPTITPAAGACGGRRRHGLAPLSPLLFCRLPSTCVGHRSSRARPSLPEPVTHLWRPRGRLHQSGRQRAAAP